MRFYFWALCFRIDNYALAVLCVCVCEDDCLCFEWLLLVNPKIPHTAFSYAPRGGWRIKGKHTEVFEKGRDAKKHKCIALERRQRPSQVEFTALVVKDLFLYIWTRCVVCAPYVVCVYMLHRLQCLLSIYKCLYIIRILLPIYCLVYIYIHLFVFILFIYFTFHFDSTREIAPPDKCFWWMMELKKNS